MNKSQRKVLGIALILMGIVTLVFMTTTIEEIGFFTTASNIRHRVDILPNSKAWVASLLGIAFMGGGIFVLISKEKKEK